MHSLVRPTYLYSILILNRILDIKYNQETTLDLIVSKYLLSPYICQALF